MRTRLLAAAVCVGLVGCHSSANEDANDAGAYAVAPQVPTDVPSMLKAGSPQLCTNAEVEKVIFDTLTGTIKDSDIKSAAMLGLFEGEDLTLAMQQMTLSLDSVTFNGANADLGSVSCNANLIVHGGGDLNATATHGINYDIRTSLTPGEAFVLHSGADRWIDEYQKTVVQLARANYVKRIEAAPPEQPAAPPSTTTPDAPTSEPATDPTAAPDTNQQ